MASSGLLEAAGEQTFCVSFLVWTKEALFQVDLNFQKVRGNELVFVVNSIRYTTPDQGI